jgi:hypothetical protein
MPEQMKPTSKEQAPDPAHSYERSDPARESGMGSMKAPKTDPQKQADHLEDSVRNKQQTDRQLNSEDVVNQRKQSNPRR